MSANTSSAGAREIRSEELLQKSPLTYGRIQNALAGASVFRIFRQSFKHLLYRETFLTPIQSGIVCVRVTAKAAELI